MLYNNLTEIRFLENYSIIEISQDQASVQLTSSFSFDANYGINKVNLGYLGVVISILYLSSGLFLYFLKESSFNSVKVILIISILFSTFKTFFNLQEASDLLFYSLISKNIASILIDMMLLVFFIIEVLKEEKTNDLGGIIGF
ncbi:hypothetical protein [Flammeovirga sp. SJP92]|uniref:hypothetical protein n=1 Tax=Flammeovirga sp. SJP92 TaxID=1775430 RepID=UPI000787E0FC|nr:hypothetical protein [Flammeovirga sp. SJP92]KXX70688.1 hypothetical protein AVL50_07685 [Flammeovirga sp. SJP92]